MNYLSVRRRDAPASYDAPARRLGCGAGAGAGGPSIRGEPFLAGVDFDALEAVPLPTLFGKSAKKSVFGFAGGTTFL